MVPDGILSKKQGAATVQDYSAQADRDAQQASMEAARWALRSDRRALALARRAPPGADFAAYQARQRCCRGQAGGPASGSSRASIQPLGP